MKRLDAYKRLNDTVQSWTEFDQQVASILIYNCFHFIKNVKNYNLFVMKCLFIFLIKFDFI